MEEPQDRAQILDVMEWVGWDRLLFASDYPHWDFDDPFTSLPPFLTDEQRRMIYAGNARELYRL
jgi:predicted TIM-barrel fold metal-dependent hydrolase